MRIDFPQNPTRKDAVADGGVVEPIVFTAVQTYPLGVQRTAQGINEVPFNAYDCRRSRMVSIQISSYNIAGGPVTVQFLVSNDNLAYAPLPVFQSGAYVTTVTIPTGGTPTVPLTTMVLIDAPWFAWLKVSVTATGNAGSAGYLTVYKRD